MMMPQLDEDYDEEVDEKTQVKRQEVGSFKTQKNNLNENEIAIEALANGIIGKNNNIKGNNTIANSNANGNSNNGNNGIINNKVKNKNGVNKNIQVLNIDTISNTSSNSNTNRKDNKMMKMLPMKTASNKNLNKLNANVINAKKKTAFPLQQQQQHPGQLPQQNFYPPPNQIKYSHTLPNNISNNSNNPLQGGGMLQSDYTYPVMSLSNMKSIPNVTGIPTINTYPPNMYSQNIMLNYINPNPQVVNTQFHQQIQQVQQQQQQQFNNKINLDNIIIGADKRTTLMLRNIPNKYTLTNIVDEIGNAFWGKYDCINLPIDYETKLNLGYAFINFTDPLHIILFYAKFYHKKWSKYKSDKKMDMTYADKQGKKDITFKAENIYFPQEDKKFDFNMLKPLIEIPNVSVYT